MRSGLIRRRTPGRETFPQDPGGDGQLPPVDLEAIRKGYERLPEADDVRAQIAADAARVHAGDLLFYSGNWVSVGWPPKWRRNPQTGYEHPRGVHWSAVSDHDLDAGDIKDVWEPSRFGWAFTLIRAYVVTGENRHAEAFWNGLTDWVADNPPNQGPNWRCGQESSIRAAAVPFALRVFGRHSSATPERVTLARRLLLATGQRVAATIGYAASQRNNHAISEAVGLYTLGVAFPSWPQARRWRRLGWRQLQTAVTDQFYPDGGYAQHSVTYHRLALQTLCWALVVGREAGARLPHECIKAIQRSVRFLHALQDDGSGYLPNLGANDGAMLLPLSVCDYRDFRPVLQAASLLVGDGRLYPPGPWDEEALWLAGPETLDADSVERERPTRQKAPNAGLLVTRGTASMALLRTSPSWRHRPSQADDLHVDVWLNGIEIAADTGTYRYSAPAPWNNGLATSQAHNTVTIDTGDRYRRIGRFLSTDWPRTRILLESSGEDWACWIVESDVPAWEEVEGAHRRLILQIDNLVLVADLAHASFPHAPQLNWNLPFTGESTWDGRVYRLGGSGWSVLISAPEGTTCQEMTADDGTAGWHSPTYSILHERRTVRLNWPAGELTGAFSLFSLEPVELHLDGLRTHLDHLLHQPSDAGVQALVTTLEGQGNGQTA